MRPVVVPLQLNCMLKHHLKTTDMSKNAIIFLKPKLNGFKDFPNKFIKVRINKRELLLYRFKGKIVKECEFRMFPRALVIFHCQTTENVYL